MNTYTVLSLGWGVQSWTLAAMSALGDLPPIDAAIHADTTHESVHTYAFAERWTPWLIAHGVNIVTVTNPISGLVNKWGGTHIPAFTINSQGSKGQIHRQCTKEWKIVPIRRYLQAHRNSRPVVMWLGISTDEAARMKPSNRKYITNTWPLIDKGMSRTDCVLWLQRHNLEIPVKSACTFCPYRTTNEWRNIKNTPQDWQEATQTDAAIRKARPPFDLFIHPSRTPIETVDFRTPEQRGQLRLWDEECSGLCGL